MFALKSLLFLAFALSSATAAPVAERQANCERLSVTPAPGTESQACNCQTRVRTDNIEQVGSGLLTGTTTNWAGGKVPPGLRGVFYMEGNPQSSECFSTANMVYNRSTDSVDIRQWMPRVWSVDEGDGQINRNVQNANNIQNICKPNGFSNFVNCDTQFWQRNGNKLLHRGDYTANQIGEHEWIRGSNIPDTPLIPTTNRTFLRYDYRMWRIIDADGKRTPFYESRYVANINRTFGTQFQPFVHLKDFQLVCNRR